jgi:hypothetical protein
MPLKMSAVGAVGVWVERERQKERNRVKIPVHQ